MPIHFEEGKQLENHIIIVNKDGLANAVLPEGLGEKELSYLGFKAELGETYVFGNPGSGRILFCGNGKYQPLSERGCIRECLGAAFRKANELGGEWGLQLDNCVGNGTIISRVSETFITASYQYTMASKEKEKKEASVFCSAANVSEKDLSAFEEGVKLGESVCVSRELINTPANIMNAPTLAKKTKELSQTYGFDLEVLDEAAIKDLGMEAYLSVARAAPHPPRLLVLRWNGGGSEAPIALVGKAVTYDTGGLSLKPTEYMTNMKADMSGSAVTIGTFCALAANKVKANVIGLVAACENSIGTDAFRPGDLIGSMSGKTIEIRNTDAEGRLTLADACYYAVTKGNARAVIDIATLTGAVKIALGDHRAAAISNDDALCNAFLSAAELSEEGFWRLPIDDEYRDLNRSDLADISNLGRDRLAGTIAAAAFVEAFTEGKPWLHLDIAGVSFKEKDRHYHPKGATGHGIVSLYSFFRDM